MKALLIPALAKISDAQVNEPNSHRVTLLMVAARRGQPAAVDYLLSRHANPNAVDAEKQMALHYGIGSGNRAVLKNQIRTNGSADDGR